MSLQLLLYFTIIIIIANYFCVFVVTLILQFISFKNHNEFGFSMAVPRIADACQIFGTPCRMNLNRLPTLEDIFMDYLWIRHDIKTETKTNKEPTVADV